MPNRRQFLATTLLSAAGVLAKRGFADDEKPAVPCDVFVYGSTPGGVAAAIEAARAGARVTLACPKNHPGGMTASGLCTTDAVRRHLFGGFVQEFVNAVRERYLQVLGEKHADWKLCHDGWYYEPSIAEQVFLDLIQKQERLTYLPGCWLEKVERDGRRVTKALLQKGNETITTPAHSFIDGTYEGDLLAAAGAAYRVGRESRAEHGEPLAGIHYMDYRSGKQIVTPQSGEASLAIQAYCARCIITADEAQRVPIDKPASYEQRLQDFVGLYEDFKTGRVKRLGQILAMCPLPRKKFEINGNIEALTSPNCPGVSWAYPEAGRHQREMLDKFHVEHVLGLIYFLQHDSNVPDTIAADARRYGLHKEEFADNNYVPWQIYVRQGRRLQGRALVTQHSFTTDPKTGQTPRVPHPVAMGEHSFDIHPCHDRRYAVDGFMEGVLWYPQKDKGPAQPGQIPYAALLAKELDNLLVPVAMSSTHIAMSVLRMEPVWMTTGQVAGLAAAKALANKTDVAQLDPDPLVKELKIRTE